jgi:hypothetical protein
MRSPRTRLLAIGLLLLDAVAVIAVVKVLKLQLTRWGPEGGEALERHLWLSCLVAWAGSGGLALLVGLRDAFGHKATLSFTLPLPASSRLRILYGGVVLQLASFWVIAGTSFGIAVLAVLGPHGALWLVLLLSGACLASLGALLLVFAGLVCSGQPPSRVRATVAALLLAALATWAGWTAARWTISPLVAAASCLVLLVAALGPLAAVLGGLYSRAFHVMQAAGSRAPRRPCMALFTGWLLRFRSPGVALFVKDLLTRSRSWASWGRVLIAIAAVLAFPLLRARVQSFDVDDPTLIVTFVVGGVLLTIVDGASSPFGGEGNRLMLLLIAPVRSAAIVRAKMAAFVLPFGTVAVATSAYLSLASGLSGGEAVHVCLAVLLLVLGISTVFVLGSVLDIDLDREVHGGLEEMLHEEAPLSIVRLALSGVAAGLLAVQLIIFSHLSGAAFLAQLVTLDAFLLAVGRRFAATRLVRQPAVTEPG